MDLPRRDALRVPLLGRAGVAAPAAGGAAAAATALPLGEMAVVGLRYHGARDVLPGLAEGARLVLRREPWNRRDASAVAVLTEDRAHRLGYLSRDEKEWVASLLDADADLRAELAAHTAVAGTPPEG